MTTTTVDRARALVRRIRRLDANESRRDAVAVGLVDGVLERDDATLTRALDALRDARARAEDDPERTGWLDAAIAFAHWGLERGSSATAVARRTQAHDFLRALDGAPHMGSPELRQLLEVDETQVSRAGRRLLEAGLVTRRKVGRQVFWQLTPRGRRALEEVPGSTNSEFWQEALRRGFDGAPGEDDAVRKQIIETTFELHNLNGIQATTFEDVAGQAGVPLETVEALFPTRDDLIRSCGAHFMESLKLPPADRAGEVFAGTSSQPERIHRLVGTLFGAYERAGDGITLGRRERNDLPVVAESTDALDSTLDTLVAEALRPTRAASPTVASLRALTDVEVWRALRDQGATPDTAVEQATGAVERWLEGQPARA